MLESLVRPLRCLQRSAPATFGNHTRREAGSFHRPAWIENARAGISQNDDTNPEAGRASSSNTLDDKTTMEIAKSSDRRRHATSNWKGERRQSREKNMRESSRTLSLLEELFPAEMKRSKEAAAADSYQVGSVREIPLQPLDASFVNDQQQATTVTRETPRHMKMKEPYQTSSVVILKGAGKHLVRKDFARVLPAGEHIEGWTTGAAEMKVIRGRNREDMTPNGDYIIAFRNPAMADAYIRNAKRLHHLGLTWSPAAGKLREHLPPPPILGLPTVDGGIGAVAANDNKSTYEDIASYTLIPPSSQSSIQIRKVQQPASPLVREILELGGYSPLMNGRKTHNEVLLRFAGHQPSLQAVRQAIIEDGRERQLHWNLWEREGRLSGVREVSLPRQPYGWRQRDAEDADAEAGSTGGASRESRSSEWRVWIASFWNRDEARRFVSAWHARDVAPLLRLRESALLLPDEEVIGDVDLIW